MVPLAYAAAPTIEDAVYHVDRTPGAEFIAGGTDMLQLLQDGVRSPAELIDINRLPLATIELGSDALTIGALCRMADVADDARVAAQCPVVAEALRESASPQVRNMATMGGNLLQRTRCLYFRDVATPCNKRDPGSGCPAQDGVNRMNAVFGGSAHCIAAYPGDLAVALVAVDARVLVHGPRGVRAIAVDDLHRLPGDAPHVETVLAPGELITAIEIPLSRHARRSRYYKVRDRAAFEWALASAAVALELDGSDIRDARVAVGGVATKPWRLRSVEHALVGRPARAETFRGAAEHAGDGARPRAGNAFKVQLARHAIERALLAVGVPS